MKDDQVVKGRAMQRFYSAQIGNFRRGDPIACKLSIARHLVEIGVMEIDASELQRLVGPAETKPAGPNEIKGAPPAKKSFGAPTAGRSPGSPSSSAPGMAFALSSSAAGHLLQKGMASLGSGWRKLIARVGG